MKGLCQSCKNWKRNTCKEGNPIYGHCTCEMFFNGCEIRQANWPMCGFAIFDDYYDYADFEPSELFGCIHYSPLPEGEIK